MNGEKAQAPAIAAPTTGQVPQSPTPGPVPVRKSGPNPVKKPLDPRALARAAGVTIGLPPREARYFIDHLAAAQDPNFPNHVCIRCGIHGTKKNAVTTNAPLGLVISLREGNPRLGVLLGFIKGIKMEQRYAKEDTCIVNGLCRRCHLELGTSVPNILRVGALEDDDAEQLRQIVIDLCLAGKASEAYERLRPLLD